MTTYPHLNDIFITERLKNRLKEIEHHSISTIIAPLGYGKTTTVKRFCEVCEEHSDNTIMFKLDVISGSYNEFWHNLCKTLGKRFPDLAGQLQEIGFPQDARTMSKISDALNNSENLSSLPTYIIVDDVHLMHTGRVAPLLITAAENIPENIHLILISRNRIFTDAQRLCAGRNLCEITVSDLMLTQEEICTYARKCGITLSEENARRLSQCSEGWISFIYLIFRSYAVSGVWQFETADIYKLMEDIMFCPLSERQQKFLIMCSVPNTFTMDMAEYLWNDDDAEKLLNQLTEDNAFISVNDEGVYRYHNMLLQNTRRHFNELPDEDKKIIHERLGDWYINHNEALSAMISYSDAGKWEKLLSAITVDRGNSLGASQRNLISKWHRECPAEILKANPEAILIMALEAFSVGNISDMKKLNSVLLELINEDKNLSAEEKNNYLGESQILMGFLEFNDTQKMNIYHRKACELMNRTSHIVNLTSPWTFCAPSVLMLYHSQSGCLDKELNSMLECMPYYCRLTDGHGSGADYTMKTEAHFLRYELADTMISYHQASLATARKQQYSIAISNEFTVMRMDMFSGKYTEMVSRLDKMRHTLKENRQFLLTDTLDMCQAWLYSLLGRDEYIPGWIFDDSAIENVMTVVAPAVITIQNQALLAHCEWARMASRGDELTEFFHRHKMALCTIYLHIQLCVAFYKLDMKPKAMRELINALEMALPDNILIPFAEYGMYIRPLLCSLAEQGNFYYQEIIKILSITDTFENARNEILEKYFSNVPRKPVSLGLTDRELDVAKLAAERRTTKEIAEILHLSEHTVKNHLTHVFEKLNLEGTSKYKRSLLEEIMNKNK